MNDHGSLTLKLNPGESILVGDLIKVTLPEIQKVKSDGAVQFSKPTRVRIYAPKNLQIERLRVDGSTYKRGTE